MLHQRKFWQNNLAYLYGDGPSLLSKGGEVHPSTHSLSREIHEMEKSPQNVTVLASLQVVSQGGLRPRHSVAKHNWYEHSLESPQK